jgi:hypothetical protein
MSGPCTLLVDPVNQTYTDAEGEHALPWHEIPMIKSRLSLTTNGGINTDHEQWAYYTRVSLQTDVPVMRVNTVSGHDAAARAMYTAANATLSWPFYFEATQYLAANMEDIDDQQIWQILGTIGHGSGHTGTLNVAKLVSTGGDITLTLAANAGLSELGDSEWHAVVAVINRSAVDRSISLIADGQDADLTAPPVVPAGEYVFAHGYGYNDFDATDRLGVKISGTLTGEIVYVLC